MRHAMTTEQYLTDIVNFKKTIIMKEIEKWISKLNSQQKMIFAIVIPVGLLVLFYPIAGELDGNPYDGSYPFRFEDTWWVWLIYIAIVGFVEYKLFENTEK